jgi:hypothetical protein
MKAIIINFSFLILLFYSSCYHAEDYDLDNLDQSSVIKEMTVTPDVIPADGVSFALIKAIIPDNADIKTVKFTSSAGKFDKEDTSTEAIDGLASIRLFPGNTIDSMVIVEAEIAGIRKTVNVKFIRAFPETIITEAGSFNLEIGWDHELTITVKLKRSVGIVTPGAKVGFRALTTAGQPIGAFREIKSESDANGLATAIYSAGKPADGYTGELYLICSTNDFDGNMISDTATVILFEPEQ